MAGVLYADSIGGIGSLLQADSNRRAAQSQQVFANLMAQQQQGQAQANFEAQMRDRAAQTAQSVALQNASLAASQAQHAGELDYRNRALNISKEYQDWLMKQPSKMDASENANEFKTALDLASRGVKPDTSKLTDSQRANVEGMLTASNEDHNTLATSASIAADTLNRHSRALKFKTGLEQDVKDLDPGTIAKFVRMFLPGPVAAKADAAYQGAAGGLKAVTDALPDLGAKASKVLSDKALSGLVRFNPNTDSYEPVIQPRGVRMVSPQGADTNAFVGPRQLSVNTAKRLGLPLTGTYDPRASASPLAGNPLSGLITNAPAITAPPPMTGTNRPAMPRYQKQGGVWFELQADGSYAAVPR